MVVVTVTTVGSTCLGQIHGRMFLVNWYQILRPWSRHRIWSTPFFSPTLSIYLLMINCANKMKGFATVCSPPRIQSTAVRPLHINKAKVTPGLISHRVVNSKLNQTHSLALPTKIPPSVILEECLGKPHKTCSSRGMFAEPKPEGHFATDTEPKSQNRAWVPTYINPKNGTWDLWIM